MSHTTKVEVQFHDLSCLKKAAKNLNLHVVEGAIKLYATVHEGVGIQLPGWKYPVVFTKDGEMFYDDFGGRWGEKKVLDGYMEKLKTEYAKEVTKKIVGKMNGVVTSVKQDGEKTVVEAEIPDYMINNL